MIAAIYARKSTDQSGVADDQKSVVRQIEQARQYAEAKGWAVDEAHVYVDDGISGAEFDRRPGFMRLLNALKPRAPFQALIMSEDSRLGREAIETSYAMKQIITAGVRVWFYLEDRERKLDSPTDKIMLSLASFADELERDKARQRTHDAMIRKAKAGHVTGGRTFGYDNAEILGPDGQRQRVERRINETEAGVVRRIFDLKAQGYGVVGIARQLNAEGLVAPRPQRQRPAGWAPSSVREVLYRDLYRGVLVWNKSRKRNGWGQQHQEDRPATEWISVPLPELRIVAEEQWEAAHARLTEARVAYLRYTSGRLHGRPERGVESKYLLPGLARCADCGAGLHVRSGSHGRKRAYFYGCSAYWNRGTTVCTNNVQMPVPDIDEAVLDLFEDQILVPDVVALAVQRATEMLATAAPSVARHREDLQAELAQLDTEISNLTAAIAGGANVLALVDGMKQREGRRAELQAALKAIIRRSDTAPRDTQAALHARLAEWRGLLRRHIPQARQILKLLLDGPMQFHPRREPKGYRFTGKATFGKLVEGVLPSPFLVASPPGFEPGF